MMRRNEKDAGLLFALALLLAMALIGLADHARGDTPAPSNPVAKVEAATGPPTGPPDCSILVPEDVPDCKAPEGAWQACPVALLQGLGCENDVLRWQLGSLTRSLSTANVDRLTRYRDGNQSVAWYKAEADGARRELEGLRGRARWGWGTALAGTAVLSAGVGVGAATGDWKLGGTLVAVGVVADVVGYLLTL